MSREIDAARREVAATKAAMLDTLAELRHRADPRTIMAETKADAIGFAGHTARARPGALVAGATVIGALAALRFGKSKANKAPQPAKNPEDQSEQATIADGTS